jgi:hypothetical protein
VFPDKPRRPRGKPEKQVQKEIGVWLAQKGIPFAVTDAGVLYGVSAGIPRGWPDITACWPGGRFVGIECKAAKGRQSEDQAVYQRDIQAQGGRYVLAHSFAEFLSECSRLGLA